MLPVEGAETFVFLGSMRPGVRSSSTALPAAGATERVFPGTTLLGVVVRLSSVAGVDGATLRVLPGVTLVGVVRGVTGSSVVLTVDLLFVPVFTVRGVSVTSLLIADDFVVDVLPEEVRALLVLIGLSSSPLLKAASYLSPKLEFLFELPSL